MKWMKIPVSKKKVWIFEWEIIIGAPRRKMFDLPCQVKVNPADPEK